MKRALLASAFVLLGTSTYAQAQSSGSDQMSTVSEGNQLSLPAEFSGVEGQRNDVEAKYFRCFARDIFGRYYQGIGWSAYQAQVRALYNCRRFSPLGFCRSAGCRWQY